jgi:selenocysteine lyase/cysteine desulfurase
VRTGLRCCDDVSVLTIAEAREQWAPAGVYLNTASYGLPPRAGFDALQDALADWHGGRTSWEHWGQSTDGARAAFARLVAVAPAQLAEAIDARTDLVAFSAVQMSTGEVADLDAIVAAAGHHGAATIVDATQAIGWLPLRAERFGAVVCSAYKWLMSPRGTAFMVVGPDVQETLVPHSAGWFAGEDVHASYFGPPLRLARDARRFDTSPAWFSWVGTQPALELVNRIGVEAVHAHDVALANRFRSGLGMAPSDSAIVSVEHPGAADRLRRAGIQAAVRGGRLRVSCHVYNDAADVDAARDAIAG